MMIQPMQDNKPYIKRAFGREITNIIGNVTEKDDKSHLPRKQEIAIQNQIIAPTIAPTIAPSIAPIDPLQDYLSDIYTLMRDTEGKYLPQSTYIKSQADINEKMRAILIDWLIEVHLKFKLLPETLFLTVSLIDRYLEKQKIMRQKLQLVGVTAMLIACKYEEIYAPEVKDFVFITDRAYTKEEILTMEVSILQTLGFNITMPSCWRFLQQYSKLIGYDKGLEFNLSQYLIELALLAVSYTHLTLPTKRIV